MTTAMKVSLHGAPLTAAPTTLESLNTLETDAQSTMSSSKILEQLTSRPEFPCTDEQRNIPPFELDPDDTSMVIPAGINRFLRDYQRRGALFLYTKYKRGMGGILGDDMGLGKTVQVIAFVGVSPSGTNSTAFRNHEEDRNTDRPGSPQESNQKYGSLDSSAEVGDGASGLPNLAYHECKYQVILS